MTAKNSRAFFYSNCCQFFLILVFSGRTIRFNLFNAFNWFEIAGMIFKVKRVMAQLWTLCKFLNSISMFALMHLLMALQNSSWWLSIKFGIECVNLIKLIKNLISSFEFRYGLGYEDIEKGLPTIDTSRTLIREVCPPFLSGVECRPGKYRRFDGLCNNLEHPTWGAAMTPFQRLIGPLYADGISAPRISVTGHDLPLSRVVSRTIHPDEGFHDVST